MNVAGILSAIKQLSVLVVGDICLDRWCRYQPALAEPSRETGIKRIAVVSEQMTPGAAGTVASNLVALGAKAVTVLGAIGNDGHGFELKRALSARGIDFSALNEDSSIPTFTYTKLINADTGVEDQSRVDFILAQPVPSAVEQSVISAFEQRLPAADIIIVSDQAETDAGGIVTDQLRGALATFAKQYSTKLIWVDSRKRGEQYRHVLVKLNEQEAAEACARAGAADYRALRSQIDYPYLIVTSAEKGALLVDAEQVRRIATQAVLEPVDICGAGDSFNAGAALAWAVTGDPEIAIRFGNLVASITIMKPGTGTASPDEVLDRASR